MSKEKAVTISNNPAVTDLIRKCFDNIVSIIDPNGNPLSDAGIKEVLQALLDGNAELLGPSAISIANGIITEMFAYDSGFYTMCCKCPYIQTQRCQLDDRMAGYNS